MINSSGYGAIKTIDDRANYFGAMYGYTGQPWFREAEKVSRNGLSGYKYSFGNGISDAVGPPLNKWRDEAGAVIMKNAKSEFQYIYQNYRNETNSWSYRRLVKEQKDPKLQAVHEKWYKQWNIVVQKIADKEAGGKLLNPYHRIDKGCKGMPEVAECKIK
ncbi:hypothetical protein LU293_00060 [Moraxella nasovis]|uniref:hypothetical protein n=1 Tax=Moraxella nasovis TaxID=2904121 RepID=UPI001F61173D|nr:hypothetical protein [Moraxella nasovis]UNU73347.1 hypothetical protein LU293_00060 [Moraxella nasovis]